MVKSAWTVIDQLRGKSEFGWDENMKMVTASPTAYSEYVQVHPSHEKYLNKKIEMYDEMAIVVGKDWARGNFAKSFVDIDLDSKLENESVPMNDDIEDISKHKEVGKNSASSSVISSQPRQHRKRSHDTNDEESNITILSEKLGQMTDAISRFTSERLNVQALHDEIMKMEGFDEAFLGSAFDYLVEHEMLGKEFMAKINNLRRIWLEIFLKK